LGVGFFSPFGLGAKWPPENPLRYLGYEDDMKTFFFNPTIAFKLTDQFSIGVGVSYIYSTVKFNLTKLADFRPYGFEAYDVPASLEGNGHSFNFNAGLLYRGEKFNFGLNYRSRFDIEFKGDMKLDTSNVPAFLRGSVATAATGKTTFRFPDILGVGVSFNVTPKFLLSADAHYVLWNRFDKYVVDFSDQDQGQPLEPLVVDELFKDSWTLRGGLQYMVTPKFALRAGYLWDQAPQPVETMDPLLPDANRNAVTAGIGYTFGKVTLDVTYHHEIFNDRVAPNRFLYQVGPVNLGEGTYKTTADLLGISLSFVF
jgi:long-chain fatty acid transport protein